MMKRSSVFVLWIVFALLGCFHKEGIPVYSFDQVVGTYYLTRDVPISLKEKLFPDATTGWDFEDPSGMDFYLNPDSTYEMDTRFGDFEGPSYTGKWQLFHDTVRLYNIEQVTCSGCRGEECSSEFIGVENMLVVKTGFRLQIVKLQDTDTSHYLLRRKPYSR